METILLINGKETGDMSKGAYNTGLIDTARETLKDHYEILETVIEDGYDAAEEYEKFKKADIVVYQYPVFWFSCPAIVKKYIDDVYGYDLFFGHSDGPYGTGGLMAGKKLMLSTTWNAPLTVFDNPDSLFEGLSFDQALVSMKVTHKYCGFEILPHFHAHNIVQAPNFEEDSKRFAAHLTDTLLQPNAQAAE